jgi:hypothetical protein
MSEYKNYEKGACVWREINPKLFNGVEVLSNFEKTCIGDMKIAMQNIGTLSCDESLYRGVESVQEHLLFKNI